MKKTALRAILFWIGLIIFLVATKPENMPLPLVIIPYALLYGTLFFSMRYVYERTEGGAGGHKKLISHLPVIIASTAVILLALQSIGQLSIRDVIAVLALIIVGYFYIRRNTAR